MFVNSFLSMAFEPNIVLLRVKLSFSHSGAYTPALKLGFEADCGGIHGLATLAL
jgi:hypothetical protein